MANEVDKKMEVMKEVLLASPLPLYVVRLAVLVYICLMTLKGISACIILFDV